MADVLNRNTLELRRGVRAADYRAPQWLINPDLSAVAGVPRPYWKVIDRLVMEMDSVEKAAVDRAMLADARTTSAALLEIELLSQVSARYPDHRRQLLLSLQASAAAEGLTRRAAYLRRLPRWIEDGLRTRLYPAQDAIHAATSAAAIEAIELDLDDWLKTDPCISVRAALEIDD